jgi:pyruvate/2-oxoglutarate/acetoin dehydrogenase E1 component
MEGEMREITFRDAIKEAIDEEMERDTTVFLIGTSVGAQGGSMRQIQGIFEKHGAERVRTTPICESTIMGVATGAAATGMRPIAEATFADFLYIPMDDIVNVMTKLRWLLAEQVKMPVVIRSMIGAGLYSAFQHSQSVEGMFICTPGLKVIIPSTPYDCKGLLKSAIRDDNPVLFLEHKLFNVESPISKIPDDEYTVPLGKADVKREGSDVTVVATALMVHRALAAADKLQEKGIGLEVVDPRTLVPLDKKTIIESIKKTYRLVIMTEECRTGSAAGEIAAIMADEAFDYLDAPIKRVNAPDAPVPYGPAEDIYMPNEEDLIEVVTKLM